MRDLPGIRVLEGQGRGLGGNAGGQPRAIQVPVQHPEQPVQEPNQQISLQEAMAVIHEQRKMIKEQEEMMKELLAEKHAERQERQIERQLGACRLMECNLEELLRSRNSDSSKTSHDGLSHKNPMLKRKFSRDDYQGKGKESVQTGQQNHPRIPSPLPCWKYGYYHPNVKCVRIRVCYKCRKPGHVIKDCSEYGKDYQGTSCNRKLICFKCQRPGHISVRCPRKAAKMGLQNSGQMMASLEEGARKSSGMIPDTIAS